MINQVVDDNMLLVSQFYPGVYANDIMSSSQESKPKRQRRRNGKSVAGESSNAAMKKRKLTDEQVKLLEQNFGNEHKLESERKDKLALELSLDARQVAVWFQNRRARWKNTKLMEEFARLKSAHDGVVMDKCRLESEVMQLKDQLGEATKEIQRLRLSDGTISSNSPISSSISMDVNMEPPFFREFGVETNVFYIPEPENSYNYVQSMEWFNLFSN